MQDGRHERGGGSQVAVSDGGRLLARASETLAAQLDTFIHAADLEEQDRAVVGIRRVVAQSRRAGRVSDVLSMLAERRAAATMPGRFPLDRIATEYAVAIALDETGQQARAIEQFERAGRLEREISGLPEWRTAHLRACALVGAAWACHRVLRVDHAKSIVGPMLEVVRGLETPRLTAEACVVASLAALDARELVTCFELADEAVTLSSAIGARDELALAKDTLGQLAVARGELLDALANFNEALMLFDELSLDEGRVSVLRHTGDAYLHIGDTSRALAFHQRSLRLAESVHDIRGQIIAHSKVCRAYIESRDLPMARRALAQSIQLDLRLKHEIAAAYMHLLEAELSCVEGEPIRAATHADHAYRIFDEHGDVYHAALATAQKAQASAGQRNFGGADRHFTEAVASFRRLGAKAELARTLLALGDMRLAQGELATGLEALLDAMETADQIDLRIVRDRCQQTITTIAPEDWTRCLVGLYHAKVESERLLEHREQAAHFIAHDLKSPITNIRLSIDHVLSEADDLRLEAREALKKARAHCNVVAGRIGTMMSAYTLSRGALKARILPVPINDTIREAWGLIGGIARSDLDYAFESSSQSPMVMADVELVQRVLENLMGNACRYAGTGETPRKPEIRVGVVSELSPGMVRVYVRDNGPGIPPSRRGSIFDAFERVDEDGARMGATGLGLHFVKQVIELHGGRVWVECPPSGGSVFCFELPSAQHHAGEAM